MSAILKFRRATAAVAATNNVVLAAGEPGYTTDTGVLKIGDGTTAWSTLASVGGGSSLSEGGTWATATAYVLGKVVTTAGRRYVATAGHTSGTFSTDLAAGKWVALDAVRVTVYDIRDPAYGAKCDGTTNDATAIQAAIDACAAAGGGIVGQSSGDTLDDFSIA